MSCASESSDEGDPYEIILMSMCIMLNETMANIHSITCGLINHAAVGQYTVMNHAKASLHQK